MQKRNILAKILISFLVLFLAYNCAEPQKVETKKEPTVDDANEVLKRLTFFGGPNGYDPHVTSFKDEDFNQWAISSLTTLVQYVDQFGPGNYILEIKGHADSAVGKKPNQWLSEQRAKYFYDKLVKAKIPQDRMKYVGVSANEPMIPSEPDARKNRRISFRLIKK